MYVTYFTSKNILKNVVVFIAPTITCIHVLFMQHPDVRLFEAISKKICQAIVFSQLNRFSQVDPIPSRVKCLIIKLI